MTVENEGILWKTKQFSLITANADGTFASTGKMSEKIFSILDDKNWEDVNRAFAQKKVIRVKYRIKTENPWDAQSSRLVVDIED